MENVIETRGLTKRYGSFAALDDVGVTVRRGEVFGLVGDNGAGKWPTLFKLLCGLAFPTIGEIRLFGEHSPRELERQRARIGCIIEQPGFYPHLSVERNLECCRIQKGVPGKNATDRMLEEVGLAYARDHTCKDLSMGMKQRLGLAMALIGEPEVLILDEPASGLDPSGIVEMRTLLQRLNREKGHHRGAVEPPLGGAGADGHRLRLPVAWKALGAGGRRGVAGAVCGPHRDSQCPTPRVTRCCWSVSWDARRTRCSATAR